MRSSGAKDHHYAIDAARVLDECRKRLQMITEYLGDKVNPSVLDMDRTLLSIEQLLHYHLFTLLEKEGGIAQDLDTSSSSSSFLFVSNSGSCDEDDQAARLDEALPQTACGQTTSSLMKIANDLKQLTKKKHRRKRSLSFQNWKDQQGMNNNLESLPNHAASKASFYGQLSNQRLSQSASNSPIQARDVDDIDSIFSPPQHIGEPSSSSSFGLGHERPSSTQEKSAIEFILFRLIVVLQLCLVRIEEAECILCGMKFYKTQAEYRSKSSSNGSKEEVERKRQKINVWHVRTKYTLLCTSGVLYSMVYYRSNKNQLRSSCHARRNAFVSVAQNFSKGLITGSVTLWLRRFWRILCMNARLFNSILSLEDLQQQWILIQSIGVDGNNADTSDQQCKRLLELMPLQSQKSSLWNMKGFSQYGIVKFLMDTLYASVGKAIEVSKWTKNEHGNSLIVPITAAAAASYYAVVGPEKKSAEVVSGGNANLIRNAWGVVSLPAIKTLSLQASRLLKRASIAERITIKGVVCFVLSKDGCPEVQASIRRFRRQKDRATASRLSTIQEQEGNSSNDKRAVNLGDYPKKDVIFHLTGGGFFAHTIAGDVPYLLDWSAVSSAIVICPEYALLPEHKFPVAIDEVVSVYTSLVNGEAAPLLGFQTDKIIVTGESTGGNLATSLCVKLCMDGLVDVEQLTIQKRMSAQKQRGSDLSPSSSADESSGSSSEDEINITPERLPDMPSIHLPDALMLSCPALNLSLELSPSRVIGGHDPVLPSSLISTISDAYIPEYLGVSKTDPIASPYFAPDAFLRIFPPTLVYASSEDPLLDDSVHFNARLRRLGVDSDLRALQNMPHAYWGLGIAGFPSARQVQRECQDWMIKQLARGRVSNDERDII